MGAREFFPFWSGGLVGEGPYPAPPLPSVALCALKDAALDLMRAPGRRAWLWALYPAPPCPPPQPRLRVRGGAPFFGGSKNHPLPLQSRKGVDFSPPKWEKRPFGGGGRERKIGGFAKKRGGGRRRACAAASEGWRGEGEGGWPPKAAPRPRRGAHRAGWSLGGEGRGEGGVRGKGRRWRAKRATLGGSSASEARARTP